MGVDDARCDDQAVRVDHFSAVDERSLSIVAIFSFLMPMSPSNFGNPMPSRRCRREGSCRIRHVNLPLQRVLQVTKG
ncbi:hypothetical protein [Streptomyces sp. NPDC001276]|uniref:hypothetical protein n=1 Tax=unclassified Streptomyces TaxID=2593676 RepID=UPI0036C1A80C